MSFFSSFLFIKCLMNVPTQSFALQRKMWRWKDQGIERRKYPNLDIGNRILCLMIMPCSFWYLRCTIDVGQAFWDILYFVFAWPCTEPFSFLYMVELEGTRRLNNLPRGGISKYWKRRQNSTVSEVFLLP